MDICLHSFLIYGLFDYRRETKSRHEDKMIVKTNSNLLSVRLLELFELNPL
jgi:hypothetical protein